MEGYSRENFDKAQTGEEKNAMLEKAHEEASRENKEHDFYTVTIDRSRKLDEIKGWNIVEEDQRSLEMTKIDLNKVVLKNMLNSDELQISREELLSRIKTDKDIHLDAKVFEILMKKPHLIPASWKQQAITSGKPLKVIFDGSFLRYSNDSDIGFVAMEWNPDAMHVRDQGGWQILVSSSYARPRSGDQTNYVSPVLEVTE